MSSDLSRKAIWAGRILGAFAVLFLTFDAVVKLLHLPMAVEGTVALGYPEGMILPLGIIELLSLVAYVIPRTSALGALVFTGYLGGAVATHVRIGHPLFSHTLFPVYVKQALDAGGKPAMPPQDHGFMYGHSFYDLDGHHWEVLWMDPAHVQSQ